MANIIIDTVHGVMRRLAAYRAHREELRTERHLNALPDYLLKDIGWPDAYAERLAQRNSMKDDNAGPAEAGAGLAPWHLNWPKQYEALKTRKSSVLEVEC
ncbi:MAG: DUF1127 domain-containing protein [Phyllobacterium sp.]